MRESSPHLLLIKRTIMLPVPETPRVPTAMKNTTPSDTSDHSIPNYPSWDLSTYRLTKDAKTWLPPSSPPNQTTTPTSLYFLCLHTLYYSSSSPSAIQTPEFLTHFTTILLSATLPPTLTPLLPDTLHLFTSSTAPDSSSNKAVQCGQYGVPWNPNDADRGYTARFHIAERCFEIAKYDCWLGIGPETDACWARATKVGVEGMLHCVCEGLDPFFACDLEWTRQSLPDRTRETVNQSTFTHSFTQFFQWMSQTPLDGTADAPPSRHYTTEDSDSLHKHTLTHRFAQFLLWHLDELGLSIDQQRKVECACQRVHEDMIIVAKKVKGKHTEKINEWLRGLPASP